MSKCAGLLLYFPVLDVLEKEPAFGSPGLLRRVLSAKDIFIHFRKVSTLELSPRRQVVLYTKHSEYLFVSKGLWDGMKAT